MTRDQWDEFKEKAAEDDYLQEIISGEFHNNHFAEHPCPLCSGLGYIVSHDEQGGPTVICCMSCGYGISGELSSQVTLSWAQGGVFQMVLHKHTFKASTSLNLNRIARALEAIATKISSDADVQGQDPSPME